jgi:hypothetical protein
MPVCQRWPGIVPGYNKQHGCKFDTTSLTWQRLPAAWMHILCNTGSPHVIFTFAQWHFATVWHQPRTLDRAQECGGQACDAAENNA